MVRPVRWLVISMVVSWAASCRQTASEPTANTGSSVASGQSGAQPPTRPATEGPAVEGPAVVIQPSGRPREVIHVEVARTERVRERGLMFRTQMAEDHGMIFVFPAPAHQVFWMHNTLLPLDMIFIREDRTILGIVKNATPETDDPREVPGLSSYVLEMNGGWADRHHVAAGDRVDLVGIPPAAE